MFSSCCSEIYKIIVIIIISVDGDWLRILSVVWAAFHLLVYATILCSGNGSSNWYQYCCYNYYYFFLLIDQLRSNIISLIIFSFFGPFYQELIISMIVDKDYSFTCVTCPDVILFRYPFPMGQSIFCLYFNFFYVRGWYWTCDEGSDLFILIWCGWW
jgi:hypothetical protein